MVGRSLFHIPKTLSRLQTSSRSMSTFTNYNKTSAFYDNSRLPAGVRLYMGQFLLASGKTASQLHVLDAGCGTGNYSKALLDLGLGRLSAFDASAGMLEKCKQKLQQYIAEDKVELKQNLLPEIPFVDNRFDGVMFNLVLHHLGDHKDQPRFKLLRQSLEEARRVLTDGGKIVISTISHPQYSKTHWFTKLAPSVLEKHLAKYAQVDEVKEMLSSCGFRNVETVVPVDHLLMSWESYSDLEGPGCADWRATRSFWDSGDPEEIQQVEKDVMQMAKTGALRTLFDVSETDRKAMGQITLIFAEK